MVHELPAGDGADLAPRVGGAGEHAVAIHGDHVGVAESRVEGRGRSGSMASGVEGPQPLVGRMAFDEHDRTLRNGPGVEPRDGPGEFPTSGIDRTGGGLAVVEEAGGD